MSDGNLSGNEWDWLWDKLTSSVPGSMNPDDSNAASFPTGPSYYVSAADTLALAPVDFDPSAGMEQFGLSNGIPPGVTIPGTSSGAVSPGAGDRQYAGGGCWTWQGKSGICRTRFLV